MDALHIISDQKNAQGGTASSGATQATPPAENTHKKSNLRGGRGRKAGPELTRAVHDVQASEVRLKHDIARLNLDKERLSEQVGDLEARLKVAREEGLLKSTIKRLEALLAEAHDKLNTLSGVIPAESTSRDRTLMEDVLKKWREYEHERTNQARAESKINKNPEDKRAEGDFNRARATAHALKQEIHGLVKQGDLIVENEKPNPVQDEWVSYTNEQAEAEKLASLPASDQPNIEYRISNIEENRGSNSIPVSTFDIPLNPSVPAPIQHSTFDIQHSATAPDLHPANIDTDIHPAITDGVTIEKEPEAPNEDYLAKAQAGDEAWELAQQQLKILEEQNHALEQEILQEPLIVPEELKIETKEEVIAKEEPETVDRSEAPVAPPTAKEEPVSIEQPESTEKETVEEPTAEEVMVAEKQEAPETEQPLPEISAGETRRYSPTMPQEIAPTDQLVLAYADKQVHEHIDNLFGEEGRFGFGKIDGMESANWKDAQVGFANKTVAEIMGTKLEVFPSDGKKHFGIEDYATTKKMQEYLELALKETGVHPWTIEKAGDYLKRASAVTIGKFIEKE